MPDTTAGFMFARVATIGADASAHRKFVRVPLIGALLDEPSRYTLHDPRIAPPAPPPALPRRRGARGPSAATIEKLWAASDGDRDVLRQKLERQLRRAGVLPRQRVSDGELERIIGSGPID